MTNAGPKYRRVLLKLSGEALVGENGYGIDADILKSVAGEIGELKEVGVQIAMVIGAGNIFRGAGLAAGGMERVTADHIVLATGAVAAVPPIPGLREMSYLTNEDVWELDSAPDRLVVLGGGLAGR